MNLRFKSEVPLAAATFALVASALVQSPANAQVNGDLCNWVSARYSGGGFDNLLGSAQGLVLDSEAFGSDISSPECQAFGAMHYDSTVLESVAHTGNSFSFFVTGNYVGNNTTCSVSVKLNDQIWIQGTTQFYADTYQTTPGRTTGTQGLDFETLSAEQKNLFNALTNVGNNELKVIPNCPAGYEQANITLKANIKIVQDSFNEFEGVSIEEGAEYINSRNVDINLSFVNGVVGQVMISNDGGFPSSQRQIIDYTQNTIPWTLNATRDERMVKTVYVKYKLVNRYTGALESTWSPTLSDDIILDTTAPKIKSVIATEQKANASAALSVRSVTKTQSIRINLSASDNKSGINNVQYSTKKGTSGAVTKTYAKEITATFGSETSAIYVRVSDNAGNWSSWKTVSVVRTFANCAALNKVYKGGVAKSTKFKNKGKKSKYKPTVNSALYLANKGQDKDKDNIVCEK